MAATTISRRATLAGIVGNVLEWYDFAVYGYFAPVIGRLFFPSDDPSTSVIAAFGVFAAGFLMRPVGSAIFGHIGDKIGRHTALVLSVALMAVPTFCIGLLPDHAAIGVAASVLLVILRMLQGLSVGGEYTTSIVFLIEQSPPERRAFAGCWSVWGAVAGILAGSAVGAAITNVLSPDQVAAWGWRVPFLLGIGIGVAGLFLRRENIDAGQANGVRSESPIVEALRDHWRVILKIVGFNVVNATSFYLCFVYVTTWLEENAHFTTARALDVNTISMALILVFLPVAAWMSDRFGRKPMLYTAMGGFLLLSHPLFVLMHHDSDLMVFAAQFIFVILVSLLGGSIPVIMVEMVAPRVRVSALSIGYNFSVAIFGGTSPLVAAYLIARTSDDLAPAWYLMATAAISLAVLFTVPETAGKKLEV